MKWIIAFLIFSLLVLFHEFGHFLVAKMNGVVVEEFSLGFGPRLLSTVRGGTRYSLKLLLFGGSCQMKGMYEDYDEDEVMMRMKKMPGLASLRREPLRLPRSDGGLRSFSQDRSLIFSLPSYARSSLSVWWAMTRPR